MTKQITHILEKDELNLLREQLSPEEVFLLGFLKGFDRNVMREWDKNGLWNFDINE